VDMSKYRDLFITETREHLGSMNGHIVSLEKDNNNREEIDSLFRSAHSIKGMAASMGYSHISELAHRMEDLMDRVRKGTLIFNASVADLLLEGVDLLSAMVEDLEKERDEARDISRLIERISGYDPSSSPPLAREESTDNQPPTEKRETPGRRGESVQSVRVKTEILDRLINTTGELITNRQRLLDVGREVGSPRLDDALTELTRLLRELHGAVMRVRMMPFSSISNRFPRMVRDLAKKSGKEVEFVIEGEGIELDRSILEEISDPLVHILRNAIDHGLESIEERVAQGKAEAGKVRLSANREKDRVVITVEDDGKGMDPATILAAAAEKGFLDPAAAADLSVHEILLLTCAPGFSTAREITDVSGRGVGMDSVNTAIQSLSGTLAIESEPGKGSRIIIRLPTTISIINVLLARLAAFTVAFPVTSVSRTLEVRSSQVSVRNGHQELVLDGETIPVFDLGRLLTVPPPPRAEGFLSLFLTEVRGRRLGISVDKFLGQREVFVKPLGRPISRMKGVTGGTVLGDGEIVFVLDVASLL
jgi:two-component system, chemotaxis family, sensor kinase CheA